MNGITGAVKDEMQKQEGGFLGALLAPLAASIVQPVISSVVKYISGRGYMNKKFEFHSILQIKSRLLIISITKLDLMAFFQEKVYLK